LKFECDFVVRHDNGGLEVEEIRAFELRTCRLRSRGSKPCSRMSPRLFIRPIRCKFVKATLWSGREPSDWASEDLPQFGWSNAITLHQVRQGPGRI